jgi:hypothetical protein
MTVIVKHNKTNSITDWTQAQLDEQIALGNFPSGTTLANIVLPSDWNNDHTLTGLGTMAEQDATAVAITGGTINNTTIGATTATTGRFTSVTTPSVTATTTDLTLSAISTGAVNLATAGGTQFQIANTASTTNYLATTGSNGGTPALYSAGASTNIGTNIVSKGTGSVAFYTNGGVVQQVVSHTASAVNYVQVTGAATTIQPIISAQGSDGNIALNLRSKGTSGIWFGSSDGAIQFQVTPTTSAVNNLRATGSIAGNALPFVAGGSDTNISMAFQPKGTGAIDLAAGSKGVNISNGGTVTAITRTVTGSGYTSFPSVAISAPTTAGGVQATASVGSMVNSAATIAGGGTGYTVGNVLTVVGGTPAGSSATLTVATVSSGVITSVTPTNFGQYTALPTNPVSVTGGSGSGATLNLTYGVGSNPSFTISNAGSGYIEQPTVTISGGGGSGAAAFATVGGGSTIKAIGQTGTQSLDFSVASSASNNNYPVLRIKDTNLGNGTNAGFLMAQSNNGYAQLIAQGPTNAALFLASNGTGDIRFNTNSTTEISQMRITHTASAVNYVQVTGSATGNSPTISTQGSDANINFVFNKKGTGNFQFVGPVILGSSGANYVQVVGAGAGSAPSISSLGSDTNINLTLTPKGTGRVQFGTYTGTVLVPTGFVEILDSSGTTRRLLVG